MNNRIVALIVCVILSLAPSIAADKPAENLKLQKPKDVPAEMRADIFKAMALEQAAARQKEQFMSAIEKRIQQSSDYKQVDGQLTTASDTVRNLTGKARAATGAPPKCELNLNAEWFEPTERGPIPCMVPLPEPTKEAKK